MSETQRTDHDRLTDLAKAIDGSLELVGEIARSTAEAIQKINECMTLIQGSICDLSEAQISNTSTSSQIDRRVLANETKLDQAVRQIHMAHTKAVQEFLSISDRLAMLERGDPDIEARVRFLESMLLEGGKQSD